MVIFVGVDWAEAYNDVAVMDEDGAVLGRGRFGVGVSGLAGLHALIAGHAEEPDQVMLGIEVDHGLLVSRLPGLRPQSAGGEPLPRSPHHLGGEIGSR
jgi:hypothetical protein